MWILKSKNKKVISIILAIFTVSSIITIKQNERYNTLYSSFADEKIKIIGTVCSSSKETDYKYAVTIKVNSIIKNNKKITKKYKGTKLLLYVDKKDGTKIEYGNMVTIEGTFQEPTDSRNYKGFSYKNYLKTKKIYGSISAENINVTRKNNINIVLILINKLSNKFKENLSTILEDRTQGLAKGILLRR